MRGVKERLNYFGKSIGCLACVYLASCEKSEDLLLYLNFWV